MRCETRGLASQPDVESIMNDAPQRVRIFTKLRASFLGGLRGLSKDGTRLWGMLMYLITAFGDM